MKSSPYLSFSVFLLTLIGLLTVQPDLVAADSRYKIGVILPLTGTYASLGTSIKDGIDVAYMNLDSDARSRLELIFEDDQLNSVNSVSAYRNLVAKHGIDAVMVAGSGVGNAVVPLAERDGKVSFAIGASDVAISKGKKYAFVHWVSPQREAKELVNEIQARNLTSIVLISNEQDGAIALEKALHEEFKTAGIEKSLVMVERELLDNRDFRTTIAKIRAKKPDGIALTLLPGSLSTFVKQARTAGITAEIFGFELFEDANEVDASSGTLIGSWYVNASDPTGSFAQEVERVTSRKPAFATGNSHDALLLIYEALMEVGHDNSRIAEYLRHIKNFTGACGTYDSLPGNLFDLPVAVKKVTKDGFVQMKPRIAAP